eukprot:CAMPEP_0198131230 /NCGR_PEP_ID=MMETSP1442-20131203/55706_1 /TAXON_ID= /ORGANISM="Craspedostauros australis, Strain CCMP3328" /LENGTH=324 /DNA_ID=CAMNT_0043791997 /DNA_START=139 /DNA_END=1113 /DNA_ORIENTATION=-
MQTNRAANKAASSMNDGGLRRKAAPHSHNTRTSDHTTTRHPRNRNQLLQMQSQHPSASYHQRQQRRQQRYRQHQQHQQQRRQHLYPSRYPYEAPIATSNAHHDDHSVKQTVDKTREHIPTIILSPVLSPLPVLQQDSRLISYDDMDELNCKLQTMYKEDYYNGMRCMLPHEEAIDNGHAARTSKGKSNTAINYENQPTKVSTTDGAAYERRESKRSKISSDGSGNRASIFRTAHSQPQLQPQQPQQQPKGLGVIDDSTIQLWVKNNTVNGAFSNGHDSASGSMQSVHKPTKRNHRRHRSLVHRMRNIFRRKNDHLSPELSRPVQ